MEDKPMMMTNMNFGWTFVFGGLLNNITIFSLLPFVAMLISWVATSMKNKTRLFWLLVVTVNLLWAGYGLHKVDLAICTETAIALVLTVRGFMRSV